MKASFTLLLVLFAWLFNCAKSTPHPSGQPTSQPSSQPSVRPTTSQPSSSPTSRPSKSPTTSAPSRPGDTNQPTNLVGTRYPTTPTASPLSPTTAPSTSSPMSASFSTESTLAWSSILGITIGCFVFACLCFFIAFYLGYVPFRSFVKAQYKKVVPDVENRPVTVQSPVLLFQSFTPTIVQLMPVFQKPTESEIIQPLDGSCKLYDVFLTHDWGIDERNRDNHARVVHVSHILKDLGMRVWIDEKQLTHTLVDEMTSGIDGSHFVITFVTKRYMDKVNGKDARDNCKIEFNYAFKRLGPQRLIPVVMEERMRNQKDWSGLLGAGLISLMYTDMVEDESLYDACKELKIKVDQMKLDEGIA